MLRDARSTLLGRMGLSVSARTRLSVTTRISMTIAIVTMVSLLLGAAALAALYAMASLVDQRDAKEFNQYQLDKGRGAKVR
jgi:hypothetical protein